MTDLDGPTPATRRWAAVATPDTALFAVVLVGLGLGGLLRAMGADAAGDRAWIAATAVGTAAAGWWVAQAAWHRRLGVDLIALLALAGTLAVAEYLAGAVISVMLATGRSLESWAAGRSQRELRALLDRAPRLAHRREGDELVDVAVGDVHIGDRLVVKPGEVVPVDGRVEDAGAVVDESALTGEALPVERPPGDMVRSGTVNAAGPFSLLAATTAEDSSYAGIVRLVAQAEASSAPAVRLADRYAAVFLAVSLAAAAGAGAAAGTLSRAVAVLVVATPCPLILAVPVALVSGLSRTARRGVVVKGGAVLERLARVRVLLFDKTGTITTGRPTVAAVATTPGHDGDEVLRLAASVDQLSPHVLAAAVVRAALDRGLPLTLPEGVEEVPGQGVTGTVDGTRVAVGKAAWVAPGGAATLRPVSRRASREGLLSVFVAVDGEAAGAVLLQDPIRVDAARTIRRLRESGISRIVMVTGDRADVAESVGAVIGVDEVLAERSPAEKVDAVTLARRAGPTVMVGDGINDAPALALADVGVAIGARGATASSEAADVVLAVDRLDRVGDAVRTARRSVSVATQSVVGGIGMSLVAMAVAGAGWLPATDGAVLQEFIDVAAILNALRVLRPTRPERPLGPGDAEIAHRFSADHMSLRPARDRIRAAGDAVGTLPATEAVALARGALRLLIEEILPHEKAEEVELYPMLARVLGGTDRTSTMRRGHVEIAHLTRLLGRLLDEIDPAEPAPEDLVELRRLLYGLHAVLRLHVTQEDEGYLSLADPADEGAPPTRAAPQIGEGERAPSVVDVSGSVPTARSVSSSSRGTAGEK